jgi:hypothetical protein
MTNLIFKATLLTSLGFASVSSFAQKNIEKKDKLQIRVEQEVNGEKKVYQKTIDTSQLSPKERDEIIQNFQDSIMTASKEKTHRIKIEIDDQNSNQLERKLERDDRERKEIEREERFYDDDDEVVIRAKPRVRVFRKRENDFDSKDFRWEAERFKNDFHDFGKDLKMDFRTFEPMDFFQNNPSSSKTIKKLDAFPNKPHTETLNIRFSAPEKGDVSIKILDVKGNVIAKDQLNDFTGDYIGQLKMDKALKGTVFVIVSQGEDAAMKRLVLE